MTAPRRASRITRAIAGSRATTVLDAEQHEKDLCRAARMWRATKPDERAEVRRSFECVFAKLSPEECADIAEFASEIAIAARNRNAP